MENNFK